MIGRPGNRRMNVIPLHELSEILVLLRHLALLGELLGRGLSVVVIHVTNSDDIAEASRAPAISTPLSAAPDQRDIRPIIRPQRLRLRGMGLFEFEIPSRHAR